MPNRRQHPLATVPAAMREMRRDYRADYDAGKPSRFSRARKGLGGLGDAHLGSESQFLNRIEVSRDLVRNSGEVAGTIERAVTNTIRDGFGADPNTTDAAVDVDLWERWNEWSLDKTLCDDSGNFCFPDYESLAFTHQLTDGDILFRLPEEAPQLQAIEADWLRTPDRTTKRFVHGVQLDQLRRRLAYHVLAPDDLERGQLVRLKDTKRLAAFNPDGTPHVIQVYNPGRFSLTRGVPALTPVIEKAGKYEDIDFALLVKQQMAAALVWTTETKDDNASSTALGANREGVEADGDSDIITEDIGPGTYVDLKRKTLKAHTPAIPSHETMAHLKMTLSVICTACGVPLCVLMLDGSETNFSGWRGALDQAKIGFMKNQDRLERQFHRPIYMWKLRQWIKEDRILAAAAARLKSKFFWHRWNKPRWPYTNPLQDVQAGLMAVEGYLNDPYSVAAEQGRDGDDIIDQSLKFNKRLIVGAIKVAKEIKEETGIEVAWRDVANRTLPKGGQVIDTVETENTIGGSKPASQPDEN